MKQIRLTCVVGARPNFIKMSAILEAARLRPHFSIRLIHTGQHFSPEMSQQLFDDLEIQEPDTNLGVGAGTPTEQTAEIMKKLEADFLAHRPDAVLVVGDVNSTMAAALVAVKLDIRVIHVEAGLRSFDRAMPEETNRLVTDVLSDFLFVSEESGIRNLRAEGVAPEKVFLVGNVMIDTLHRFRPKAEASTILQQLDLQAGQYAVVTLHRPSNVDLPEQLAALVAMLEQIALQVPVILPIHPRTRARLGGYQPSAALRLVPPLGYLDFMQLTSKARLVLTDSGGIQEETTVLGIPCFTLRDNTERPVTVEVGSNYLVGATPQEALRQILEALEIGPKTGRVPDLWDGRAAERIFDVLELRLGAAS